MEKAGYQADGDVLVKRSLDDADVENKVLVLKRWYDEPSWRPLFITLSIR